MTPAINLLKKNKIAHKVLQYEHDKTAESYGMEAAEKLQLDPNSVFKTLVVSDGAKQLAVCIVPVAERLNLKLAAKALGFKKVEMAEAKAVERSSGYVLGGVSPLGQKKRLPTVIDHSAESHNTIHVSAGRRGLEIELSPENLRQLLGASFAPIAA